MSTPDYAIMDKYEYFSPSQESLFLPAGAFVRPIDWYYLPKHVLVEWKADFINRNEYVFCYTSNGIIPIPRKLIIRVE